MDLMYATVGVTKINLDPTKCIMLTTQREVTVGKQGNYDVKYNGDIHIRITNSGGADGSMLNFHLNDTAWSFVTARPIVIAPASGNEGCTPQSSSNFPQGIGYAPGTTPTARDIWVTIPKAGMSTPGEYHYWLQVMKVGDARS